MATRVHEASRPHVSDVGLFFRHVDYLLLAATGTLVAYGLWIVAAVTRNDVVGDPGYYLVRQGIYVGIGAAAFVLAAAVNPEVYRRYHRVLLGVLVAALAAVLITGGAVRGSKRWLEFGLFQLQPSEIGKVLLALALAGFLAERSRRIPRATTALAVVGLAAVPTLLIFLQPDFGTALVYCAIAAAALFVAGTRWLHLGLLALAGIAVSASVLWLLPASGVEVLRPYQVERLTGFFHPDADPSGSTYNINQSIMAVGSGGLDGRGVAGATQTNLNYLPEHATDFIFASLAEQQGFLGASILLLLYALIVWRGIKIIAVASDLFSATLAGALVFGLLFQLSINVGMTIGIAPITGIPLPFVSLGGSSMISSMVMVGLLEAIHVRGRLAGQR